MRTCILATACLLALAGCGTDTGSEGPRCDRSNNLLANPAFVQRADGSYVPWSGAQHAGELSFEVTSGNGELRIEKTGSQPWYTLTQSIPARPLRSSELLFEAEIQLNLDAESLDHNFRPGGGLMVSVWGNPDPMMGGDRLVAGSKFEHEPHLGTTEWTPVATRIEVPFDATRLRVGFAHYANGSMAVRNPALYRCEPADGQLGPY